MKIKNKNCINEYIFIYKISNNQANKKYIFSYSGQSEADQLTDPEIGDAFARHLVL